MKTFPSSHPSFYFWFVLGSLVHSFVLSFARVLVYLLVCCYIGSCFFFRLFFVVFVFYFFCA